MSIISKIWCFPCFFLATYAICVRSWGLGITIRRKKMILLCNPTNNLAPNLANYAGSSSSYSKSHNLKNHSHTPRIFSFYPFPSLPRTSSDSSSIHADFLIGSNESDPIPSSDDCFPLHLRIPRFLESCAIRRGKSGRAVWRRRGRWAWSSEPTRCIATGGTRWPSASTRRPSPWPRRSPRGSLCTATEPLAISSCTISRRSASSCLLSLLPSFVFPPSRSNHLCQHRKLFPLLFVWIYLYIWGPLLFWGTLLSGEWDLLFRVLSAAWIVRVNTIALICDGRLLVIPNCLDIDHWFQTSPSALMVIPDQH